MLRSILLLVFYLLSAFALSVNITAPLQSSLFHCFNRLPSMIMPYPPDCQIIVDRIRFGREAHRPQPWRRPEHTNIVQFWSSGTCIITLLTDIIGAEDEFTPISIARAALHIVDECVRGPYHVGGVKGVGPGEIFCVTVTGQLGPVGKSATTE